MNMHITLTVPRVLTAMLVLAVAAPAAAYFEPESVLVNTPQTRDVQVSSRVLRQRLEAENAARVAARLEQQKLYGAAPAESSSSAKSAVSSVAAASSSAQPDVVLSVDAATLRLLQRIVNARENKQAVVSTYVPTVYAGAPLDEMPPPARRRPLAQSGPAEMIVVGLFAAIAATLLIARRAEEA